jgi:ATP-dependent Zn protease
MVNNKLDKIKEKVTIWGCGIALIAPFVLVGLWTLLFSSYSIFKSEQSKDWLQVPASIVKADLKTHKRSNFKMTSKVLIQYEYEINSKKYTGDRLAFGYKGSNIEDHDDLFSTLDNANRIIVYVNPNDNNESVIITGLNDSIIFVLIFSIMWNLTMIGVVLSVYQERIKNYIGVSLLFVWFGGVLLLMSGITHIDIESKINVLEEAHNNLYPTIELNIN